MMGRVRVVRLARIDRPTAPRWVVAAFACGLVLTGCAGDPDPSDPGGDTSPPVTSGEPSTDDGSIEPPVTESEPPATTVAPSAESTADRSEAPPEEVIRVVSVEVDEPDAAGAERIVIDTAGGTPGYRLRYVDAVRIDGEPVLVDGTAFLELVLESADPQGTEGLAEEVAVDLLPDQAIIKHVQFAYYLGDELTFAIGMGRVAPFTVTTTPTQIVITFSA